MNIKFDIFAHVLIQFERNMYVVSFGSLPATVHLGKNLIFFI